MRSRSDSAAGWRDLGVVFAVHGQRPWMMSHGYVPTACVLNDRIRVFAAFWDDARIGRIGFVDLCRDDPTRVIGYAQEPVLDVGAPGTFDEHGVTPMSLVRDGDTLRLYYAGWQRIVSLRYLIFTGLAISRDDGRHFTRLSDVPVLDRVAGHHLVRSGFITRDGDVWKAWLAQSDGVIEVVGKPTPSYGLGYLESSDGVSWPATAAPCLTTGCDGIFGYGRSAIWREAGLYHAMLSVRRRDGYRIEHATAVDGVTWSTPRSDGYALTPCHTGDAQTETMFPSVARVADELHAFYNGDAFGRAGIRCASWVGFRP